MDIIPEPGRCSKSYWHPEKKNKTKRASSLFKLGNHTVCPSESQGRQEGVGHRWDWFNEGFWNNGVGLLSGPRLAHF